MRKVLRIERAVPIESVQPRNPFLRRKGTRWSIQVAGQIARDLRTIFHRTLEDVAGGLQHGLSLWMHEAQRGEALIPANKLRVVYA
jgi:hypothetical protein